MEVVEFQKRLEEICSYAVLEDGKIKKEMVIEQFKDSDIDGDQMAKIIQYLKIKGIEVVGAEDIELELPIHSSGNEDKSTAKTQTDQEKQDIVPLSPEEQDYLSMYLSGCENTDLQESELQKKADALVKQIFAGDETAGTQLMKLYIPTCAKLAVQMNCEEICFEDLIQEANVGLLTTLGMLDETSDHRWISGKIREYLKEFIYSQTQQKFEDDCLIAKVEKLEAAVKDLTDDDQEIKFSVNELAIILDMDVEEIRGVLRLTGDDK